MTADLQALGETTRNALDAISVVLILVTVVFGLKYPLIARDLRAQEPLREQTKARQRFRAHLWVSVLTNGVPLLLLVGGSAYVLSPLTWAIVTHCRFRPWGFDVVITAFVLINGALWALFAWALTLTTLLIRKALGCR